MSVSGIDLRSYVSAEDARERGRAAREQVPVTLRDRAAHSPDRPAVLDFVATSNRGRIDRLVPLRIGRMTATPFTFFRGAAGLMAADLAAGPVSGLLAQICGDAHAANFGLYGTQRGQIVMDVNDFDETIVGPWEWDLERLAASLVLAGRESGATEDDCVRAARDAAWSYRHTIDDLATMPFMQSWSVLHDESILTTAKAEDLLDDFEKAAKKARKNTSAKVVAKWTEHLEDHETGISEHRFVSDPPILTAVDPQVAAAVIDSLERYAGTIRESRRNLLARFAVSDVAFRIVGTGSVGLHSYVALLHGNAGESLVLQVKQATPSALAPFLPATAPRHEGERIVAGARTVQSETDILLGWTTVELAEPLPFIVRQFRNLKGSIDPAELSADDLDDYGRLAGALLARAHARSLDPRALAGYLQTDGAEDDRFEAAIARYAVRYADRTEADHAELVAAVAAGRLPAEPS
ncbi:hypothetical protein BOX37_15355 [Nocardia mangyaensis]|uniref:DUF2252 domain-containing protein n=1 Tax=Nocardia mangyaensis TaxID=2213200 RepID=A0A1J0VST5_9NOCA|nr:DUF2252 domain-containing protein [Nocardia mangyaensis]APE35094.1 hypothetical protein BOX37_15355 [Nocardia mangyaensis]